uniref:hypothetical protein n=1 Tax=Archangium violaceum TaxID=83451 RepID=UPI00193B4691|nr:hypothetical protein [Archangium violaceum]QRK04154.1 hypothetical protein JQX13_28205 [Archangium violaceum]
MTRDLWFHGRSWRLPRSLCRALLVLALGPLGLQARAASAPSEVSAPSRSPFVRACAALESGNLDGAASDILTLRQLLPERPEPRLLQSLLDLRRTRPELGWRDAFLQAWNDIGRPDFRDSPLLEEDPEPAATGPSPEQVWRRELSAEQRFVLALSMSPDAERARALFQQLPESAPPELLVAAVEYLERDKLPAPLRARSRSALRARLATLSAQHPEPILLRALLLLEGTDAKAPFTPRELQELEALSQLPDWRQTGFLSLYRYALGHLEATGVSVPKNHAYTLAVMSLVSPVPVLLQRRTEASRDALTPAERQRLAEALWRIGSRISEESSIVERFVGLSLMKKAATELGDDARLLQATEVLDEERAAYAALESAATTRWPLPSLRQAMIDSSMSDEAAHMHAFRAPRAGAR